MMVLKEVITTNGKQSNGNSLSLNKGVFDKSKTKYNQVLRDCDFEHSVNFELKLKVVFRNSSAFATDCPVLLEQQP